VAAKRFIVDETVLEHFTAALVSEFKRRVVGDPTKLETAIGPLARDDLRLTLDRQVQRSVAMGAKVLLGGHFEKKAAGFFYPPTILTAVAPGMPAFDEELFGPVATVTSCRGDADAIRLANHSRFGLGSAVFSQDLTRAHTVARALNTGMTAINQMVVSDPRLPFGGIGESGIGVELGREGIFEFTRPKVIIAEASV
jgi:succinate-semialdehyde dehydrogenase/glutarate-semialdehyde dehydrogenase